MQSKWQFHCLLATAIGLLYFAPRPSAPVVEASVIGPSTSSLAYAPTVLRAHRHWYLDPSPNDGTGSNLLEAISAVTPNDLWTVGYSDATLGGGRTLVEHSNGRAWQLVDSPNVGSGANELSGVAALAHDNVWAAGAYYNGPNQFTLVEHWNGTTWSVVPSPNPSPNSGGNALNGVSAISSSDLWAVGSYNTGPGALDNTMVLHWDGASWQIVPSPNQDSFSALNSVSGRSSSDAWAVGYSALNWSFENMRPLAMHWDGTTWNLVSVPMPAEATDAYLTSVDMSSHNNVWAIGSYKTSDGTYHGLALQWDGQQWTVMSGYTISGAVFTELRGVTVSKQGDVWAVGWGGPMMPPPGPPEAFPGAETLILSWQNGGWERADGPEPGVGSQLWGLATFANRAWAVGNFINDSGSPAQTLVAHYGVHMASAEAKSVASH